MSSRDSVVSRFAMGFLSRFRASFLLVIALLALGYLSYSTLLKREGFPPIEVPGVIVQATYFVEDTELVDEEVTRPIESALSNISETNSIRSITADNFSSLFVELGGTLTAQEGEALIKEELDSLTTFPAGVTITYNTINASAVDGENDFLFSLSGDWTTGELQDKAAFVASELEKNALITQASALDLISEETNPLTGETFQNQTRFTRVGVRDNGSVEFDSAISIGIKTQETTGAIDLSQAVRSEIDRLIERDELDGYNVTYGGDFAVSLQQQIDTLESSALTGLIGIVIILFLFVNWRSSLVGVIFVPTVLASTFLGLYLIGYSLNVLSLFSLILVLGLVVDDAIVVVEAIDRKIREGVRGRRAVAEAINEIGLADISGTLTTVLVFIPMAFTSGILGEFIRLIPITVVLALFISLFIGLSITPLISYLLLRRSVDTKKQTSKPGFVKKTGHLLLYGFGDMLSWMDRLLARFVRGYLARKWLVAVMILVAIGLVGVGGSFASQLKFSVFPTPRDTDAMMLSMNFPEGTTMAQAEQIAIAAENILLKEAGDVIDEATYFIANQNRAMVSVQLQPMHERDRTSSDIEEELQPLFDDFGETRVRISQISAGPPAEDFPFAMQLFSDDPEVLEEAGAEISRFLEGREANEGNVVEDTLVENILTITKLDGRRFAEVKAKLTDGTDTQAILNLQEAVEEEFTEEKLADLGLESDALGFDFGQESENLSSFESTIFAMLAALIVMYILLVLLYNSFLQPLLIFLAIPFSFPGLFPGLLATGNALSFFVTLGLLGLIGIAVNNTIMLVDYANREKEANNGLGLRESIARAMQVRFRPILTTTATTVAGLLPLALQDPFWEGLSLTIIFGLISSTIMVLIFFPAFYYVVEAIRRFFHRLLPGGVVPQNGSPAVELNEEDDLPTVASLHQPKQVMTEKKAQPVQPIKPALQATRPPTPAEPTSKVPLFARARQEKKESTPPQSDTDPS